MKKKLYIFIFFLLGIIISSNLSFALPITNCPTCNVNNCLCSISNCNSGILRVYSTSSCSGIPVYQFTFQGGAATWAPSQAKTYYLKILCDDSTQSVCKEQLVQNGSSTTTTQVTTTSTTTTISTNAKSIQFHPGWNMFSIPIKNSYTVTALFTGDCSKSNFAVAKIWHYSNGKYVEATTIDPGKGYWVKMKNDCTLFVDGEPVTIDDLPGLDPGWNQIGSPTESVEAPIIVGDCKIVSGPWKYNPSIKDYEQSDLLESGKGYWMNVEGSCGLGSELPPPPPVIGSFIGSILQSVFRIGVPR